MLYITVTNERQRQKFSHFAGPLALGRAPTDECRNFAIVDRFVSRNQMRIEELPGGRMSLENSGGDVAIHDEAGNPIRQIRKGETTDIDLPTTIHAGYTKIEIKSDATSGEESLQSLSRPMHSIQATIAPTAEHSSLAALGETPKASTLANWFETLLSVQRSAAGSDEFYDETARAVVDLVGLDCGLVLLFDDVANKEDIKAVYKRTPEHEVKISRTVLSQVRREQRTFFQTTPSAADAQSLLEVEAVVASPIFDQGGAIVGVIYGTRDLRRDKRGRGIIPLEAQVIQVLAGAVTSGLARVEKEFEAAKIRATFEQFVSPRLATELDRNPNLLDGSSRPITVVFADVRGYSRISERLDPRDSYRMISEIMDRLTDRVMEHDGVIIDYYGDGLAAMWNAPVDQADHAMLACQAAIDMQSDMPAINDQWQAIAGTELRIGVGLHTGPAQVGNAGSKRRIKYGPRGHTVNLASRIEGTTKVFGVPIIISEDTRQLLGDTYLTRRLRDVKLVNMDVPVTLYELHGKEAEGAWLTRREAYEKSLSLFEQRNFRDANELLEMLVRFDDKAAAILQQQVREMAALPPDAAFDPVYEMGGK